MGKAQNLLGAKGKATCKEKTTKLWPEGEEGVFLSRAQRIVVHACAPDVAPGFTGQGVVDGGDQNLCTKR
jgi:hypothetical protein